MQHLALSDCVGAMPPLLLQAAASAASTAAISLAVTDLSTAEGAAAAAAAGSSGTAASTVLHTAGESYILRLRSPGRSHNMHVAQGRVRSTVILYGREDLKYSGLATLQIALKAVG